MWFLSMLSMEEATYLLLGGERFKKACAGRKQAEEFRLFDPFSRRMLRCEWPMKSKRSHIA